MAVAGLHREICSIPVIDVHSHLRRHKLAADNLEDVVLYHMVRYILRGADVDKSLLLDPPKDPKASLNAVAERFAVVGATSFGRMLGWILKDLYGFDEPLTPGSLPRLQRAFAKTAADEGFGPAALKRMGVVRVLSSRIRGIPPLDGKQADRGVRFTIEDAPASGTEEFLTIKARIQKLRAVRATPIRSLADLQKVVDVHYNTFDWTGKHALVAWMGARADFTPVAPGVVDGIIADALAGAPDTPLAVCLFQAAVIRCMCNVVKRTVRVFQLTYGTQTQSRDYRNHVGWSSPEFAGTLGFLLGEYPEVHFNILNGCEADEPTLCSLCNGYGNISLAGLWWHAFYPSAMQAAWHRRLEMVPVSRLCGFFSDGWCIEWTYARLKLVREVLTQVLEEKVRTGFYSRAQALDVARQILYETPRRLFLSDESVASEVSRSRGRA